jgi:seryl-tRNA synthetase
MLDIKLIRTETDEVKKRLSSRNEKYVALIDGVLKHDDEYREALAKTETLRAKRNEISQSIGKVKAEKGPEAVKAVMEEANKLKAEMQESENELNEIKKKIDSKLLAIPNLPDVGVIVGKSEKDNKVVRENVKNRKEFSFEPKDHHTLGEELGILDFETAASLSGSRFSMLVGKGAKLERALINFMLDLNTESGYKEILPPFLVTPETITGTGQLPLFEEDLYKTTGEKTMYLIPTAEVPLTNIYKNEILSEEELPHKFTAATACFRQEAGSYGKDTRGLIRNHQFNKVELVWITKPEDSMNNLEELTKNAERILQELKIPYRVIELCTGDMGFASCKTYDLEVWMPSENRFREISSCSNCWDFQARRMNTRFKRQGQKPELVHTLNGSGLAIGRTFAAILENYQNQDGSITIPDALVKYFGEKRIEKENEKN